MMSIDEIIIKTKSKFTKCKIRNPKKLIRNRIKIKALCDSRTRYFYTFHVHTSSNENLLQVGSKTMNVMVTLVSQLPFTSFQIIIDNYYSSIQIFRYLYNIKHNAIGIVQCNQIVLELAMKKSTLRETMNWRATTKMNDKLEDHTLILSYAMKNSRVVYLLSINYQSGDTITVQRKSGALTIEVPAPLIAQEYYNRMRKVDIADQL
jgi:hypothetical protein